MRTSRRPALAGVLFLLLHVGVPGANPAAAAPAGTYRVTPASLAPGPWQREGIDAQWRYHPGDDPAWARPEHDDSGWEALNPTFADELPRTGWPGIGWFRLQVEIPAELGGEELALHLIRLGALEIYVDGARRFIHDDVAAARDGRSHALHLHFLPADRLSLGTGRHLIAVRYASPSVTWGQRIGFFGGFALSFTRAAQGLPHWEAQRRYAFNLNFLFVGATGALALLHLLLFVFYRGRRENLFFGLAGWGCVGISVGTLFFALADDATSFMVGIYLFSGSIVFASLFLLRHAYEVFLGRVPRYYWGLVVVGPIIAAGTFYLPRFGVYIFCGLAFAEMLRVLVMGLVRRVDGAWIIGAGGGVAVACTALTILGDLRLLWLPNMLYLYGFLVLMVSISIHLARGFGKDKRDLETQLARNDELAAEALAQQERAHAERRAALGELLAGVSHEINSPVGALTSMSEVAARCGQKIEAVLRDAASLEQAREHPRLRKALDVLNESGAAASEAAGGSPGWWAAWPSSPGWTRRSCGGSICSRGSRAR